MADKRQLAVLRKGSAAWTKWRLKNAGVEIELADVDFEKDVYPQRYDLPFYSDLDLSYANLNRISVRNTSFYNCRFDRAAINFSDFCFSNFEGCSFRNASLRVSRLGSARLLGCDFSGADLSYCSAEETDFSRSVFEQTELNNMSLVKSNFTDAKLSAVSVYGTSVWDLVLKHTHQSDIRVFGGPTSVTVDSIELAQFIHLLVRNTKLRSILDTITAKVVLILGRFSDSQKPALHALKAATAAAGYVPVIFDFQGPDSRDVSETVSTLAHLARFVLADVSDPRSVPHELAVVIPALPSVPVQPLILAGQAPYGMLEHWRKYPWVLPVIEYERGTMKRIAKRAIASCESAIRMTTSADPGDADAAEGERT